MLLVLAIVKYVSPSANVKSIIASSLRPMISTYMHVFKNDKLNE